MPANALRVPSIRIQGSNPGRAATALLSTGWLLLEQIVEGCPRISSGSRSNLCSCVVAGSVGAVPAGKPVTGNRHPGREKSALIGSVFHGDPLRNRLQTLESCRRLEMRALLTTVQGGTALRASPSKIHLCG